ncbi:MAG: hypothetical protein D6748_05750 [Calditrichaeota bacterium]|nr:MAG: hypothetical protein D6748_05750 [Calditrichota bacterium]
MDTSLKHVAYTGDLSWRIVPDNEGKYWFAFVTHTPDGGKDIFIGYPGIEDYIRLTTHTKDDYAPAWSPDGDALAFISLRSGNGDIYVIRNLKKVIELRDIKPAKRVQLTNSIGEERDIAWNPDPKAHLIAYSRRVQYPGRVLATFQIQVLDEKRDGKYIYAVTDDPLTHYSMPRWDPHTGSRLLYVGQSIVRELKPVLYLSELEWDADGKLKNKVLEGYKTIIFKNIKTEPAPVVWLSGGKAILCQENRPEQNFPLYSIDLSRWLNKQEGAVSYFKDLHSRFPFIVDFDIRKNNLVFTSQEGEFSTIYLAQIYGEDIEPYEKPEFALSHPTMKRAFSTAYIIGGGAVVAAGAITYFLLQGGEEQVTRIPVPIGRPPSMP